MGNPKSTKNALLQLAVRDNMKLLVSGMVLDVSGQTIEIIVSLLPLLVENRLFNTLCSR